MPLERGLENCNPVALGDIFNNIGRVADVIKYVACAGYTGSNHLSRYSLMNSTEE